MQGKREGPNYRVRSVLNCGGSFEISMAAFGLSGSGVNIFKMVKGGEPFAHDPSLMPLARDFFFSQRLQQDEQNDGVKRSGVAPDWQQSLAHKGNEISFLYEEKVVSCVYSCNEDSCLDSAFTVVEAIDYSLVALPFVLIHST